MKTPPKKKPAVIDLGKCQIGQPLKLKDGSVVQLAGDTGGEVYPYFGSDGVSRTKTGRVFAGSRCGRDVTEVLPLPRKKAPSPKPVESDVETLTSLFAQIAFSNDAAWVKRAIKALQFIKKP